MKNIFTRLVDSFLRLFSSFSSSLFLNIFSRHTSSPVSNTFLLPATPNQCLNWAAPIWFKSYMIQGNVVVLLSLSCCCSCNCCCCCCALRCYWFNFCCYLLNDCLDLVIVMWLLSRGLLLVACCTCDICNRVRTAASLLFYCSALSCCCCCCCSYCNIACNWLATRHWHCVWQPAAHAMYSSALGATWLAVRSRAAPSYNLVAVVRIVRECRHVCVCVCVRVSLVMQVEFQAS